jgi:hypothetical protein
MSLTSVDLPEPLTPVTAVKRSERNGDVHVLQVVGAGAADHHLAFERQSANRRRRNLALATQVSTGQ